MKIYLVDDDAEQRMIMSDFLATDRDTVREFDNGRALLDAMDEAPDLILLDIEMPEMNGIEACRALRAAGHDHVQVIFVSGHDDVETRLTAYAAGGSDFVAKPFLPADLLAKVEVARGLMARHALFVSDIQMARSTAFTAMSSLGELGAVLQFLHASFSCADLGALAAALFAALEQYGLRGAVEMRAGEARLAASSQGECSPLELSVLSHVRQMERIFRFRSQMAVNYPRLSLVIVNLPDDEERVGRLRDHLATLVEGADARLAALELERLRLRQADTLREQAESLREVLAHIERRQEDHRLRILRIGVESLEELTRLFAGLGLGERQEAAIYDVARRGSERTSAVLEEGSEIAARLKQVVARLQAAS